MAKGFEGKLEGLEGVKRRLAAVSRSVRGKVVRKALSKTVKPLTRAAKARANRKTKWSHGWLAKSMGDKVSTSRGKGITTGIVGPRSGFSRSRKRGKTLSAFGKKLKKAGTKAVPTRYAHLVELGTSRSRAFPFIQPAWRAGKAQAVHTLVTEIKTGLAQAARTA